MVKSCWISVGDLTVDMESPVPQECIALSADPDTAHKFTAMMSILHKDSEKTGSSQILLVAVNLCTVSGSGLHTSYF